MKQYCICLEWGEFYPKKVIHKKSDVKNIIHKIIASRKAAITRPSGRRKETRTHPTKNKTRPVHPSPTHLPKMQIKLATLNLCRGLTAKRNITANLT